MSGERHYKIERLNPIRGLYEDKYHKLTDLEWLVLREDIYYGDQDIPKDDTMELFCLYKDQTVLEWLEWEADKLRHKAKKAAEAAGEVKPE